MTLPPPSPDRPPAPPEPSWREALVFPLGLLGAVGGAVLGGYLFALLYGQGMMAPFLIGGIVGFGTIALPRRGGLGLAILAVAIALAGSVVAQWLVRPWWKPDPEFLANLQHLGELEPTVIVFHLLGAVLAFVIVYFTPTWRPPGE